MIALRNLTKVCGTGCFRLNNQTKSTNYIRYIRNRVEGRNLRKYTSTPFEGFVPPNHIRPESIGKAIFFTLSFTAGSFVSVTIWEYEKIRSKALNVLRNSSPMNWLKRRQTEKQQSELQLELSRINREIETLWNKLTPGERIFAPILLANVAVFLAWRVPRLKPFMLRHFASNPASKAVCWPMFLSTFSHYSMLHLFANMYVLHSFSAAATNTLGREQFLGLYLSAGVISSLTSYMFKYTTRSAGYSLGASGAIMAILAYVCAHFPETKLSILFLPQLQFDAGTAIQAIMAFDLAGVIFRWRVFDHAAHLGGAFIGIFWSFYGQQYIWPLREHFVGFWHRLRHRPQK